MNGIIKLSPPPEDRGKLIIPKSGYEVSQKDLKEWRKKNESLYNRKKYERSKIRKQQLDAMKEAGITSVFPKE
jgi:hypothetical protein